ncbi:MAG: Immunoglobulin I-set domain protein [Pedosphaera sp.]|nr:Immunoglobulin I-set domain protein [Pedosphaera sp.]
MKKTLRRLTTTALLTLTCVCAARADITNNLALWLTLDETSGLTAHDSSANGFTANLTNFVGDNSQWLANGRIGRAVRLNIPTTTNQFLFVPDAPALNFSANNTVTVAAWVSSAAAQVSGGGIICKGAGGGSEQYNLDINGGKFRFFIRNSAGAANPVTATVGPTANFQHVAGVYDGGDKTLRIYVNGQLNAVTTNAANASLKVTAHELSIGARQSAAATYNLPFTTGVIDDVHVYGRALTASDIFELYSASGKAPIITAQPRNYSCYAGDIAAFSVTVDAVNSIVPLSYQWQLGGTNIPGVTTATLGLTNVVTNWSGLNVAVVITNVIGSTTSAPGLLTIASLPAADISGGLVGYYTFNDIAGSTTALDSTTNGNVAALQNFADYTVCWTNGLIGGGLNFNGDLSTLDVVAIPGIGSPAPAALDFTTNGVFTLAAWVNGALVQTAGAAVLAKGNGNGGEQFVVDLSGGRYRFFVRNAAGAVSTVQTTIVPNNTWQHLVCVVNTANGILNCYINGQLAGEAIAPLTLLSNAHEISIGNRQSASANYNLPWTGIIDDVRFYNRSFSAADVQALYLTGGVFPPAIVTTPTGASLYVGDNFKFTGLASGTFPLAYQWAKNGTPLPGATNATLVFTPTVATNAGSYTLVVTNAYGSVTSTPPAILQLTPFTLASALAGYWTFDDGTNSATAADASTNGNIGNLTSFPDFVSEWVSGRTNGALVFNPTAGLNEYVSVPDSASLNFNTVSNFSLAAWVKGPAVQLLGAGVIAKGYGGVNEAYAIDFIAGNFYRFYLRNAAGGSTVLNTSVTPNGQWQHIVATYDGAFTTMNFYVNGVLVASNTAAPPTLLADNGHELSIGARESSSFSGYNLPFNGTIDDVRIYGRTLSSNDVVNLYQAAGIMLPVFYTQPIAGASLYVGDNLTLSAFVDGTAPLRYQWQNNGITIAGATNSSLAITNAQLTNAGSYVLVVTNLGGSVISSTAVVQVVSFNLTNTAAYYRFDETTGTSATDFSGNTNTATLFNFPGDDSEWGPGRINGGLNFNVDGSGVSYVTAADSSSLNFSNKLSFSLTAWVKGPPAQANGAGIIAKGAGAGGEEYAMDVHTDQLPTPAYRFYARNAAGTGFNLATAVKPNGRWQYLVATFDASGGAMNFYVNGQLVATTPAPTSLLPTTHDVSIGSRESGPFTGYNLPFTGEIDEVRFYARALQVSEIQSLYALAAPFAPVVYAQASGATNYTGTSVTFAPVVDGTDPLTYQWSKNGNPISGATNSGLTLNNLQLSNAGNYSLFVTNALGSVTTLPATLQVLPVAFGSTGTGLLSDGTFQLSFSGPPDSSYSIYGSPDLSLPFAQWTLLATGNFDGNGAATYVDSAAPSQPVQFYRFTVP